MNKSIMLTDYNTGKITKARHIANGVYVDEDGARSFLVGDGCLECRRERKERRKAERRTSKKRKAMHQLAKRLQVLNQGARPISNVSDEEE